MKTLAVTAMILAAASGAHAATVLFNFGVPGGNLGPTHTYTVSSLKIIATGYDAAGKQTDLFGKNLGGDEVGLGLVNDPSGQNEIHFGSGFVQLDVSNLFGKVKKNSTGFSTNSTTQGEEWSVYGSNTPGVYTGAPLISGLAEVIKTLFPNFGNYKYYDFVSTKKKGGENYLIASATTEAVPEPAAWSMMLVGTFGLGGLLRRRRRVVKQLAT